MAALVYAFLAIVTWVAFMLLLRGTVAIWPIGLAGVYSRVFTLLPLIVWVLCTGSRWRRLLPRNMGWWLLMMGSISIGINLLWFAAMQRTTATNVALLYRLDLLFVVMIGAGLGLERIGWRQLALLPPMFVGLALVTEVQHFDLGGHLAGDLMIVVAAFGLAANAFIIRHILRVLDEESVAVYNHALSTLGFLVLAIAGQEFPRTGALAAQPMAVVLLVSLGLVGAVALPLYYAALRRMAVWKLRAYLLSAPVMVAVVEVPVYGVRLSLSQLVGATLVLGGLGWLIHTELRTTGAARPVGDAVEAIPAGTELFVDGADDAVPGDAGSPASNLERVSSDEHA